ncbi:hypothetical protein P9314_04090 [Paenibacillus validus]|uniref:Uncharacterized protein n=1 Tax=Paenibacillus validus TaxID=44253 RepID=A0A7X2ZE61_9BACL|nr:MULTISPECIES: hypothetical protein [Paenibacillus]MED4599888.1 hypothetical protein [Paenibacillus validus]MED4608230.1 hypothetical protein [Paenibacillus validus]MUG73275.1 hypothetical protein [Paenibacillus validus]
MDDPQKPRRKFLFKVDILIEEETNGLALETLLHLLNSDKVEDYQVKEGVELGKKIEYALKEAISKRHVKPFPAASHLKVPPENTEAPQTPGAKGARRAESDPHRSIWEEMKKCQENNSLLRLSIVKEKGVKLSMPCRIINIDPPSGNLSVYHVDEKKVYLLQINEIDDFEIS